MLHRITLARSSSSMAALAARPALAARLVAPLSFTRLYSAAPQLDDDYQPRERYERNDRRSFGGRDGGRRDNFGSRDVGRRDNFGSRDAGRRDNFGGRDAGRRNSFGGREERREATPAIRGQRDDDGGYYAPEVVEEIVDDGIAAPETAESPDAADKAPVSFQSLKGRINYDTLKSLTFKPMNLKAMSEVQQRVLGRMPELSGGKTGPKVRESEAVDDVAAREEREKSGREDLLVKAKTGTGKTIAFLVPAIDAREHTLEELVNRPNEQGETPTKAVAGLILRELTRSHAGALIISPTRELATQIAKEAEKLHTWHKDRAVQLFVGGGSRSEQLRKFKSIRYGRKDVIVATPGRLVDLLNEPEVAKVLATTDMFILDEADTLLDMGFSRDLEQIVRHLPKERQTFLFSATVSPQIQRISKSFLKPNFSFIDCVPKDESNVHKHIPQYATVLEDPSQQIAHIARLIAHDQLKNENSKVIVFLPTTMQTRLYASLLREFHDHMPEGLSVHEIHSRLDQDRRSRANERFRRDKRASVLVTSDVSARGVDYPNVTRVIQIGIPQTPDQYIHRVGRTGRAGKTGGRGDLVLLPFEAGFLQELGDVPLNQISSATVAEEVNEMAANAHTKAGKKVANIDEAVQNLLPMIDPEAVKEVFMSLLGYYLAKGDVLRNSPRSILEGIRTWSTQGLGLEEPPHVSDQLLQRLGVNNRRGGGNRGSGNRGSGGGGFGLNRSAGNRSSGGYRGSSSRDFAGRSSGGSRGY